MGDGYMAVKKILIVDDSALMRKLIIDFVYRI